MRQGGCQCGGVRYECADTPLKLIVCHCAECRKQSASAFGMTYQVPKTAFRLTRGAPRFWTRASQHGATIVCAFCPECGSRVWHASSRTPDCINVKAGSLDEPMDISGAMHIWTDRCLPGVVIPPGALQFAQQPV